MPETRWLSKQEQEVWRAFLGAIRLLCEQLDHDLQSDAAMPHAYYEILVALSEATDRSMRMSELAEVCWCSRSRLSHAVNKLEELGWVERKPSPLDKRGAFAVMTDKGFAVIEAAAPGHVESVRTHLFDQLTPLQVAQLGAISAAVRDGLVGDVAATSI